MMTIVELPVSDAVSQSIQTCENFLISVVMAPAFYTQNFSNSRTRQTHTAMKTCYEKFNCSGANVTNSVG